MSPNKPHSHPLITAAGGRRNDVAQPAEGASRIIGRHPVLPDSLICATLHRDRERRHHAPSPPYRNPALGCPLGARSGSAFNFNQFLLLLGNGGGGKSGQSGHQIILCLRKYRPCQLGSPTDHDTNPVTDSRSYNEVVAHSTTRAHITKW